MLAGSCGQQWSELVHRPSDRRVPRDHVLSEGLTYEVLRGDDSAPTGVGVGLRGDAEHAAEVIGVRVGVDHGDDGSRTQVLVGEVEARPGAGFGCEWVDDDPAGLTGDEGDVRDVVPAGLPDAGCHLEQSMDAVELGLPPQAGVHRVGVRAAGFDERIAVDVAHDTERCVDGAGRMLGHKGHGVPGGSRPGRTSARWGRWRRGCVGWRPSVRYPWPQCRALIRGRFASHDQRSV